MIDTTTLFDKILDLSFFIVLLFCGTIAKFIYSRFHLYDDVINGLCRILHRNLFEYGYLCDKPCVFCHCHNYSSFTPNGVPSANVYSLNTDIVLCANDSFVEYVIWTSLKASDHDTSPIQQKLPFFFDFNHPNG